MSAAALEVPAAALGWCREHGFGEPLRADDLDGGVVCRTRRIHTASGRSIVVKELRNAAADFFPLEATALAAVRQESWTVPAVLAVAPDCLVLEDLGSGHAPCADYWEYLGRAWARLHGRLGSRYGWERDLYYGRIKTDNRWRGDGHAFYAETRFLPWLQRPGCTAALDRADRRRLERIAGRLAELVPAQPPAQLHGDLWSGNLLVDRHGGPAVIDPSPHFGWPEADLHNAQMFGGFDPRFFAAYRECRYLEPGWSERLELHYLPHLLGMIEHGCDLTETVPWTRRVLERFC